MANQDALISGHCSLGFQRKKCSCTLISSLKWHDICDMPFSEILSSYVSSSDILKWIIYSALARHGGTFKSIQYLIGILECFHQCVLYCHYLSNIIYEHSSEILTKGFLLAKIQWLHFLGFLLHAISILAKTYWIHLCKALHRILNLVQDMENEYSLFLKQVSSPHGLVI